LRRAGDLLLNLEPPNISGMAEATILKFCKVIDRKGYQTKIWKKWSKGVWCRSRDLLLNFGTPSSSLDWLKIQTSNFVGGLRVRNSKQKICEKGRRHLGHVTYF